jgi:hypothetical protein
LISTAHSIAATPALSWAKKVGGSGKVRQRTVFGTEIEGFSNSAGPATCPARSGNLVGE